MKRLTRAQLFAPPKGTRRIRNAKDWLERAKSVRRNAIADDADSAVPLALDKGLPFGIGDKVGATVTNRARSDGLAHEVG